MKKIYLTISNEHKHRFGNTISMNLFARSICEHLEESCILGTSIPEFNILNQPEEKFDNNDPSLLHIRYNQLSSELIANRIEKGPYRGAILKTTGLWYPNLKSQKIFLQTKANELLKKQKQKNLFELDFLINLRLSDILNPFFHQKHKMFALDINFLKTLVDEVGITPTFVGQLTESSYLEELKKNFPKSKFYEPDPIEAFLSIMTAKRKVLSLSTFSWMAAWCGNDDTKIHLPITGLYDGFLNPGTNLTPFDDNRYIFHYLGKNLKNNSRNFQLKLRQLYIRYFIRFSRWRYYNIKSRK